MSVHLDESFVNNIAKLSYDARIQIGWIIKALEDDPKYEPATDIFYKSAPGLRTCQSAAWDGWKLGWYHESEQVVVAVLLYEPLQLQRLRRK
jgi:hypothetical protein